MPELPEVETIRRELVSYIVGRNVRRATVLDPKLTLDLPLQEFEFRLVGQRVERIDRRGKYLLLRLTDRVLILHLMMSGRVHLRPANAIQPHTRLVLEFDRDPALHFVDVRRFGRAWALDEADLPTVIGNLGPEPLGDALQLAHPPRRLPQPPGGRQVRPARPAHRRRRRQHLRRRSPLQRPHPPRGPRRPDIHPQAQGPRHRHRRRARIRHRQPRHLIQHLRNQQRRPGGHQHHLQVFRRTGEPCPRCGRPIRRIVVGQRSTHYCSFCQRRPRGA